ncbi:MAG TPA: hypothetical protein VGQ83_08825 [Polyangia bacterium]|jgi:hypothetical protein
MRAPLAALLLAATTLTGCAYQAVLVTDEGRAYPPTNPAEIRFHPGRDPGFRYEIIGRVASFAAMGEAPEAMRELALAAAAVGADAVLDVKLQKLSKNTGASGLAVKRVAAPPRLAPPAPVAPPPAPPPPPAPAPVEQE